MIITKDVKAREQLNLESVIKKSKSILLSWLQRDLSIFGRVLISKVEILSRLTYPAFSLAMSDNLIKKINQITFNFVWKNKHHYIRRNDVVKTMKDGGLNIIDFEAMNAMIKLKWLQQFICNNIDIWHNIPSKIFSKCGGIEFLLKCDFCVSKLPIKLSRFHQQVLLCWKLAYKHNFTPHNSAIWNNRYILSKRKSLCFCDCLEKGIWLVVHLMDSEGNLLDYADFINKYNINCTKPKYLEITRAVPEGMMNLTGGMFFL